MEEHELQRLAEIIAQRIRIQTASVSRTLARNRLASWWVAARPPGLTAGPKRRALRLSSLNLLSGPF
jgi:hypothetical protein